MSGLVRIERDDAAFHIRLNRPEKMNALSAEMVEALIDAVEQAHRQDAGLITLEGEGRNFSAGFDFSDVDAQSEGDLLLRFVRIETLLQLLRTSPCLTVALAHGRNFGAGVDLFAACRLRYADKDATFRMPGLKFGLVLGTRHFAALVGAQAARALLETAATFDAAHAREIGFLQAMAPRDEWAGLRAQALARAAELPRASRAALYDTLADRGADEDLSRLVRSAAAPGLKQRIAAYLGAPR
ncbi:enoyl-CoA hydratase/isomerase family protein [Bordetella genomosp. 11]|uniref:Enoyl-CoA hydratase n=1 Tax=Bordetella genomosp. 11 TaxID=1416808 RepID=A0A261UEY3_9BORD|nr:enoyl-CoA hydratase/isomerase family protein [Bordetella genomosp. 11]OZI60464.1 enoyl-CoA hydratase [Bordetella genomosp. 11]